MKIAVLGTRGIPARYGGFETFAEEVSVRLVASGHELTVYCRRPIFKKPESQKSYRGVKLISTPTIMHKYLETPIHSLTSFLDVFFRRRFDAILLCNAANSPFSFLARLKGIKLYINVDGVERKRAKWNFLGRLWYLLGEVSSVLFANKIICDAEVIAKYYRKTYRTEGVIITYGATKKENINKDILEKFGLSEKKYILYVSRLEPENNALGVIQSYTKVKTDLPLVVVGDAPYADNYKKRLRAAADSRVVFTGYQFGDAYHQLRNFCYFYVQATEVGGTHPALVEAMAYGNCIVANAVPEHLEVLGEAGLYYEKNNFNELADIMQKLVGDSNKVENLGISARQRALKYYTWERVVKQYLELFN